MLDGRASSINYAAAHVPAILHAWFPGEFCGQAVAEALFGDYNPGGRLAVTFPKSVGQIPFAFPFKPGSDESSSTSVYGALYPFGHGLSYTTFTYSDLHISPSHQGVQGDIHVSCKIKNTGKIKGDEVVQLYLRDEISSVTTYTKFYAVLNVSVGGRRRTNRSFQIASTRFRIMGQKYEFPCGTG